MRIHLIFKTLAEFEQYRLLHLRTVNTLEPHVWPAWLKELDEALEKIHGVPESVYRSTIKGQVHIEFDPSLESPT